MRVYVLWYKENKNGAIMDVTKLAHDATAISPQVQPFEIINSIKEVMSADDVITCESEEEMIEMFSNTRTITKQYGGLGVVQ